MLRKNPDVVIALVIALAATSACAQTSLPSSESAIVRGSVVDLDRKAVSNAKIFAWPMGEIGLDLDAVAMNPESFADRSVSASSTGQDGRFEILLRDRRYAYHVIALAEGFAPMRIAHVTHERGAVDFRLDRGYFVHGIVQDAEGAPMADANVTYHGFLADAKFRRSTTSAADGKFRIERLPEAPKGRHFPHFLLAHKQGSPAAFVGHARVALQKVDLQFFYGGSVAIILSGSIQGVVTTTDGRPVADADVSVLRHSWGGTYTTDSRRSRVTPSPYFAERIAATRTDADGRYRIDNLPIDVESILVEDVWQTGGSPVPILEVEKEGVGKARKWFGIQRQSEPTRVDIEIGRDSLPDPVSAKCEWEPASPESGKVADGEAAASPSDLVFDPKVFGECILTVVDDKGDVVTDRIWLTYGELGLAAPRRVDLKRFAVMMPAGTVAVDVEVGRRGKAKQRFLVDVIAGKSKTQTLRLRKTSPVAGQVVAKTEKLDHVVVIACDESGLRLQEKCSEEGVFLFKSLNHGRWTFVASMISESKVQTTTHSIVVDVGPSTGVPPMTLEPAAGVSVFVDLSGEDPQSVELRRWRAENDGDNWGRRFRYTARRDSSDDVHLFEMLPEAATRIVDGRAEYGVLLPFPAGLWDVEVEYGGEKLFGGRCEVKAHESTTLTVRRR